MADEVGVAADRRREVAVRAAREARVAEVPRVVARLLQRAQDERRERLPASPRLLGELADPRADPRREPGRLGRREVLRHRRRRHLERLELREQELDRLRIRPLVHPVERLAAPPGEERGNRLVREDHQLLDERVGGRLLLDPGALHPALAVERERRLARLDPQRAAAEAAAAQLRGQPLGEPERLGRLLLGPLAPGQDRLGVPVGQPPVARDQAAVEERLAGLEAAVERDLDRHAAPLDVRAQAAEVARERVRQHRLDRAGHVDRERALRRVPVERRAGRHVRGHVGDVHPRAQPVALALDADRVVEVLRALGVDRVRGQAAEVDAAGVHVARVGLGRHGRRRAPHLEVPEEPLEHRLDVVGPSRAPARAAPCRAPRAGGRGRRPPRRRRPCGRRRSASRPRRTGRRRGACRAGRARRPRRAP